MLASMAMSKFKFLLKVGGVRPLWSVCRTAVGLVRASAHAVRQCSAACVPCCAVRMPNGGMHVAMPAHVPPQEPAGKGITQSDKFRINTKFIERMRRIRVHRRGGNAAASACMLRLPARSRRSRRPSRRPNDASLHLYPACPFSCRCPCPRWTTARRSRCGPAAAARLQPAAPQLAAWHRCGPAAPQTSPGCMPGDGLREHGCRCCRACVPPPPSPRPCPCISTLVACVPLAPNRRTWTRTASTPSRPPSCAS